MRNPAHKPTSGHPVFARSVALCATRRTNGPSGAGRAADRSTRGRSGERAAVDRDVVGARLVERFVVPVRRARLELESCLRRHAIELRRRAVVDRPRAEPDAVRFRELDQVALSPLRSGIVRADAQDHPVDRHGPELDDRAVLWRLDRDERLDDESTARVEAARHGGEAQLLVGVGEEAEERVVRDVDEGERSGR